MSGFLNVNTAGQLLGSVLAYAPAAGALDANPANFSGNVGRLEVTLAGNTTFNTLKAGQDGQILLIGIAAGNFVLTLAGLAAGAFAPFRMSGGGLNLSLNNTALLVYYQNLSQWVIVP